MNYDAHNDNNGRIVALPFVSGGNKRHLAKVYLRLTKEKSIFRQKFFVGR